MRSFDHLPVVRTLSTMTANTPKKKGHRHEHRI
ncbi:MAG: hypothetical protein QOF42_3553, partial [Gammaproteobacteria bacterium]|nr:hypothetical protein [Gammaproteobacteria bacterium]